MKTRHVFSTPDLATATAVMDAARGVGIDDDDLLLVARSDIELESIPNERKEADTDFMPAAVRGAGYGGAAAMTVAGAMVGCWASALVGSSLPDPIRAKFDAEIKAGNILVVVDGDKPLLDAATPAMTGAGGRLLPFEASKVMA